MKTNQLLDLLLSHQDKALLFEYEQGKFVGANYHITEVKNTSIESVDCGGQMDSWNETVIQLWESPAEKGKTEFMSVYKALSILKKVNRMKAYDLSSEVKFEYGNDSFHTAQLFVNDFDLEANKLIIKLAIKQTDCKAKELCGVPAEKVEETADEPCCSPDGNCC